MASRIARTFIFVLVFLALLLPLFLAFDFHASRRQTTVDRQLSVGRSIPGEADGQLPESMRDQPALAYSVTGDDRLADALRGALDQQLRANPILGDIVLIEPPSEIAEAPYLIIEITRQEITWTPVYATATLTAQAAFSSDGDVSFRERSQMGPQNGDRQPLSQAEAEFQLRDTSWGLISRPAYLRLVATSLAENISQAMTEIFE